MDSFVFLDQSKTTETQAGKHRSGIICERVARGEKFNFVIQCLIYVLLVTVDNFRGSYFGSGGKGVRKTKQKGELWDFL